MATILVVDDRPMNRQYLVTLLGYFGHRCVEAGDGAQALNLAESERPDLVITDLVMPNVDGKELCLRLHANPELADVPIIIYSATYSVREAQSMADAVGAFGTMPKPSTPETILKTVNAALGLPEPPGTTPAPEALGGDQVPLLHDLPLDVASLQAISYRLATLVEMTANLAGAPDPESLIHGFTYMARKLATARQAIVGLFEGDGSSTRLFCSTATETTPTPAQETQTSCVVPSPGPESLLGQLVRERKAQCLHQVTALRLGIVLPGPGNGSLPSVMVFPFGSASRPLGWGLVAGKLGTDAFREDELPAIVTLAGSVAVAYERLEERRHAEEARNRASAKFEALFEACPDALVAADEKGRITQANAQTEKLFGYDRHELVGQSIELLVPERFRQKHSNYRAAYHVEPHLRRMDKRRELYARRKDGTEFPADIALSPLTTQEGRLVLSAVRDISARKAAEERIGALNLQLENRVRELQVANESLESFSYSISHDLRAPLRAIDGFARLLVQGHAQQLGAEGRRLLDVVSSSARRMGRLIEDLLAFSRVGRTSMAESQVDMTGLAQDVIDQLRASEPARQVRVTLTPLPPAAGDAALLEQVFVNLINNSWKFTQKAPQADIEVGAREEAGETVYYVRDNGAGFDMQYAEKLFGVFQRMHSDEEFEGTGIGLALVQRIVQRHGGRVWAEAKLGEGATFYFVLNRAAVPPGGSPTMRGGPAAEEQVQTIPES